MLLQLLKLAVIIHSKCLTNRLYSQPTYTIDVAVKNVFPVEFYNIHNPLFLNDLHHFTQMQVYEKSDFIHAVAMPVSLQCQEKFRNRTIYALNQDYEQCDNLDSGMIPL